MFFVILFLLIYSISCGYRPVITGTDFEAYNLWYGRVSFDSLSQDRLEPLFQLVGIFFSALGVSSSNFFSLVCFFLSLSIVYSFKSLLEYVFEDDPDKYNLIYNSLIFSLIISFALPFYFNASTNVIRAGLSFPFILLSIVSIRKKLTIKFIIYSIIAIGFHYSSALFILFYLVLSYLDRKVLNVSYIILCILYSLSVTKNILTSLGISWVDAVVSTVEDFVSYADYQTGYRLDFLAFTLFILFSYIFLSRFIKVTLNDKYFICDLYKGLTFPFLLVGFGAFSDRYLLNAWLLSPILISIPISFYLRKINILTPVFSLILVLIVSYKVFFMLN